MTRFRSISLTAFLIVLTLVLLQVRWNALAQHLAYESVLAERMHMHRVHSTHSVALLRDAGWGDLLASEATQVELLLKRHSIVPGPEVVVVSYDHDGIEINRAPTTVELLDQFDDWLLQCYQ